MELVSIMPSAIDKYYDIFANTLNGGCTEIKASMLDIELDKDAYGYLYDLDKTKVKVCLQDNKYVYSVRTASKTDKTEELKSAVN